MMWDIPQNCSLQQVSGMEEKLKGEAEVLCIQKLKNNNHQINASNAHTVMSRLCGDFQD